MSPLEPRTVHETMAGDHERLRVLLSRALREDGTVDMQPYDEFRRGLLRHIGIEERILFREIRRQLGRTALEVQLHRDHAVLGALLVPPPTSVEINSIRSILNDHDRLEEDPGGLYGIVDRLSDEERQPLLAAIEAFPQIPPAPHSDTPLLRRTIEQLFREAEDGRRELRGH